MSLQRSNYIYIDTICSRDDKFKSILAEDSEQTLNIQFATNKKVIDYNHKYLIFKGIYGQK